MEDVINYCNEKNYTVNAEQFIDYYESNGWKVGKNSMKDWKAAIRTWSRNNYGTTTNKSNTNSQASGNVFFDILREEGKM